MFKNRAPELKELNLDQFITLAKERALVIVLKNGDHATFVATSFGEFYLTTNSGKSIPLKNYNLDLTYPEFPDYDIEWIYGRKEGKSLFARDYSQVIYDAKSYLTFDQARKLAGENFTFKHEYMPYYHNIYGVLEWMRNNKNIGYINKMLDEKKWQVLRTYRDPKIDKELRDDKELTK